MSKNERTPGKLVLVRHGQSDWNRKNLTDQGRDEAIEAGRTLAGAGLSFDIAYTSVLIRAIRTLWLMLDEMGLQWIAVERHWRLNERHYGALQGLDKARTAAEHGEAQVKIWRRSYDVPPPPLAVDDERHPRRDPRYARVAADALPATESLKGTLDRVRPYWEDQIFPQLALGRNVLIAAHGNSLRALVKMLEGLSDEAITEFNIPTGAPRLYEFDAKMQVAAVRYLGDLEAIEAAARAVADQAKA
jgi:2,3-bisphosphoglycerate-dependent phosphoglycerate mutase